MYAPQANPPPYGTGTTVGIVAVATGGVIGGALATRAILRRVAPPPPQIHGEAGSLMIGAQDAAWSLESSVGGETMWTWVVHTMPTGKFIASSEGEFGKPEEARADLLATGISKGWVFE